MIALHRLLTCWHFCCRM